MTHPAPSRLLLVALLSAVSATSQIGPVFATTVGQSAAGHQLNWNLRTAQGYRPISISVAGSGATAEYTAVWVQRGGAPFVGVHGVNRASYESWAATQRAGGYRPYLVSCSGTAPNEMFAGVYLQDGADAQEFTNDSGPTGRNAWGRDNGYVPTEIARFSNGLTTRFVSIWEHPTDRTYGAVYSSPNTTFVAEFNAHTSAFQRLNSAVRDGTSTLQAWRDDSIGNWEMLLDLTAAQLQTEISNRQPNGIYPIDIQQGGVSAFARYTVVFATRDTPRPRSLVRTGIAVPEMAPFDTYMEAHVRAHGSRSATIAVTKYGRLVYARAYTLAETGVVATQPTDLFRIASLTKPLTGLMVHLLYQRGGTLTPNTTFASYLGLNSPYSQGFLNATVQQALQHRAGFINDMSSYTIAQSINQTSPTLPVGQSTNGPYLESHPMYAIPGTTEHYSNAGYYMLCEAIKRASGKSYEAFLQDDICTPLGVSRMWLSSNLVTSRRPGEVEFHNNDLELTPSAVHTDRRILPVQYGGEGDDNLSRRAGAGGVLTSTVDFVRVIAGCIDMAGEFGSVFTPSSVDTMLAVPAVGNTTAVGFDHRDVLANGVVSHSKDGALWGSSTRAVYRSDGVAIAVFDNVNGAQASTAQLNAAADAVTSWPGIDLFPNYGLPSFVRNRPRVDSVDVTSLPNVTDSFITVTGDVLANVDRVTFGATAVTSLFHWSWADGWLERISDQELRVHVPQGLVPGTYQMTVRHGILAAPPVAIAFTRATNRMLGGPSSTPLAYDLVASRGGSSLGSFVYLGASTSNSPSFLPNVISLGIGNNFNDLLVLGPYSFNPFTSAVTFHVPDMGPTTWRFQVALFDPNALNPFPVPTTNVRSVQGQ